MGAGLFPLLIYVVSSLLLGGPGPASTLASAAVSSVEDFIVLNSACYYESDYVNDNLRLRDLVAASDVIIKAFAGDGNYLRPGLVASGREPTKGGGGGRGQSENHRHNGYGGRRNRTVSDGFAPEQQEHGNEENGNASSISEADFVLRLEPSIVYKGNEVYKKLKLINWQHYVVIKSIADGNSKLRRSSTTTTPTPSSSAQSATNYISSRSKAKCNRTRLITRNINNSSSTSSQSSSETTEVHAESRTLNSSSSRMTTTTMQDNKLSRSKETSSNTSNISIDAGSTAANNTREPLTVASVFSEILPTELIIFGRLDDTGNLQVDLFSGLLHWDEELQNAIWRELGWSDWSEYTPCSVSCGKGVQQRFRHCLKSPQAGHEDDTSSRGSSKTMSSTRRATPPASRQPRPYVNIAQHPRKDDGGGVMNNENVNPSSLFTTPLTASTRDGGTPGGGGTVEPTVAFATTTQEVDEKEEEELEDGPFSDEDDEEQEDERDEDEDANSGAEPPAGRDTPVSTADLQPAIERHFNESTNANSGERSIRRQRRRRRLQRLGGILQQEQKQHQHSSSGDGEGGKKHITAAAADSGATEFCEGYNIEQRSCNMFECTGALDLLAPSDSHQSFGGPWDNQFNDRISQMKSNFTLILNLRSRNWHHRPPTNQPNSGQHPAQMSPSTPNTIVSLRSQLAMASSLSINFANDGHGGLKVIQEKFGLSEMLPVERNLLDGKWHSVALSGRNSGGYVAVYIDCRWANSFVLSRGAIELPQYPVIEAGHDIELGQLTLVPGDTAVRLQCATDTIPITDIENRQVTSYFEGIN